MVTARELLFWLSVLGVMLFAGQLSAEEIACQSCHPDKVEGRYRHEPSNPGGCPSCHVPTAGKSHPRDKMAFKLAKQGAELCYGCHENLASKRYVHAPVAAGECLSCHEPHGSGNEHLVKASGAQLCLMCHENNFDKKHVHGPVAGGNCLSCHDPHQSDNRYQLKKYGSDLCFLCHANFLIGAESIHGPIMDGECTACHQPHASDNRKLLVKPFPEEFYLPYTDGAYALCFKCHSNQLVLDQRTLSSTAFRNGDKNLHYVHVNRPDHGRSCKVCHDPHASRQQKLIKQKVPGYGNWDIPINYTKTFNGGTCVVGCHKTRSYERD